MTREFAKNNLRSVPSRRANIEAPVVVPLAAKWYGKESNRRTYSRQSTKASQTSLFAPSFARWSSRREKASLTVVLARQSRETAVISVDHILNLARLRVLARAKIASFGL